MPRLKTCPICGGKNVVRESKTLNLPTPRGAVRVTGVAIDRCKTCGEEFLDSEASRKIDAMAFPARGAASRRKTA
jgi:YgiT-type zinc finger domain-containing protein